MSPEDRSLLEKTYALMEENNKILLSMRKVARIHLGLRVFYWVLIIGISVGALYFIQPYIDFLTGLNSSSSSTIGASQSQSSIELLQDLLK